MSRFLTLQKAGPSARKPRKQAGFLLLETMLGVMIFAIGMLALARGVEQCLKLEAARVWDDRARLALENRMAEIEAGAVRFEKGQESAEEKMEGMFEGITLRQSRQPLEWEEPTETGKPRKITGLEEVQIEARWQESGEPQRKQITFYVLP